MFTLRRKAATRGVLHAMQAGRYLQGMHDRTFFYLQSTIINRKQPQHNWFQKQTKGSPCERSRVQDSQVAFLQLKSSADLKQQFGPVRPSRPEPNSSSPAAQVRSRPSPIQFQRPSQKRSDPVQQPTPVQFQQPKSRSRPSPIRPDPAQSDPIRPQYYPARPDPVRSSSPDRPDPVRPAQSSSVRKQKKKRGPSLAQSVSKKKRPSLAQSVS